MKRSLQTSASASGVCPIKDAKAQASGDATAPDDSKSKTHSSLVTRHSSLLRTAASTNNSPRPATESLATTPRTREMKRIVAVSPLKFQRFRLESPAVASHLKARPRPVGLRYGLRQIFSFWICLSPPVTDHFCLLRFSLHPPSSPFCLLPSSLPAPGSRLPQFSPLSRPA